MSLKKTQDLINKSKDTLLSSKSAFKYKSEILYHSQDYIEIDKNKIKVHLFYNEKKAIDYKHYLYARAIAFQATSKILDK